MRRTERIKRGDIVLGQPLPQDVHDFNGSLLLKEGYVIKSQKQLNALFERGAYFVVDDIQEDRVQKPILEETKESTPWDLINDVYSKLSALCSSRSLKSVFSFRILDLCKKIQLACRIDEDASLGIILLNKNFNYSIAHQIHCAVICEVLSKYLEHPSLKPTSLLAAALTMNIAMVELQNMLFNQKEKLDDNLKKEVQSHPRRGMDLLRSYGVADEVWLTTILQHHEFTDGSGYPQKLLQEAIDYNARILTLADVYCVKLFSRAYRFPLPPDVAAREIITGSRGQCLDQDLAKMLVKEIGIFHPGTYVRLINGEIAVVTKRGKKIHHPVVRSIIREDGVPFSKPVQRDCSKERYAIINTISPKEVNLQVDNLLLWDAGE